MLFVSFYPGDMYEKCSFRPSKVYSLTVRFICRPGSKLKKKKCSRLHRIIGISFHRKRAAIEKKKKKVE